MIISRKDKKSKQKKQSNFSCFKALVTLQSLWIAKGFNKILAEAGVTKREQRLSPKELALATMVQPFCLCRKQTGSWEQIRKRNGQKNCS